MVGTVARRTSWEHPGFFQKTVDKNHETFSSVLVLLKENNFSRKIFFIFSIHSLFNVDISFGIWLLTVFTFTSLSKRLRRKQDEKCYNFHWQIQLDVILTAVSSKQTTK